MIAYICGIVAALSITMAAIVFAWLIALYNSDKANNRTVYKIAMILKECKTSVEYEAVLNGPIAKILRECNSNSDHSLTPNAWVRLFTNVRIRRFLRHERPVGLPVDGVSQVSAE